MMNRREVIKEIARMTIMTEERRQSLIKHFRSNPIDSIGRELDQEEMVHWHLIQPELAIIKQ